MALEQKLGELYGILKGLTPALERLEKRQNETECEASAAKERIVGMQRELDEFKKRNEERVKDLYGKYNEALGAHRDNATRLDLIDKDIEALKKKEEGLGQKAWDIVKILLATAVSAYITWRLTKGG